VSVAGEALTLALLLQCVEDRGWQALLHRLRPCGADAKHLLQPSGLVSFEPCPDAVAVHEEPGGGFFATLNLAGADEEQQVEAIATLD
jgi:hypothetical protein